MRTLVLPFVIGACAISIGCADVGPGADGEDTDAQASTGSDSGAGTLSSTLPPTQSGSAGATMTTSPPPSDDTSADADGTGGTDRGDTMDDDGTSTGAGGGEGSTAGTDTGTATQAEDTGSDAGTETGSDTGSASTGDPCGNGVLDPGEDCDEDAFARDACSIEDAPLECGEACQVVEASCCAPAGTACVAGLNECCNGCDGILGQCS